MAQTGFGMGFDLDGLDRALRSADKGIQDLAKQAEVQTKRISDAFSLGAAKGISQLSRELSDVKSGLAELTNKNYEIKLSANNFGQEVIDEVNRVINYTRQEFERVSREKVSKFLIPDAPSQYNFGMNAPSVDLSSIDSIMARLNVLKEALDTGELNNRKVDDTLRVQINDETKALNEWLGVLKMSTDEFNAAKTAQARSILETAQMQIDATNAEIKRKDDEKAATLQSISEKAAAQQEYNNRMTALREGENAAMERQLAYYKESQSALAEINNIQAIAKDTEKNAKDTKLVENAKEVYAELEEQKRIHQERMKAITERYPVETELIDKDFAIKNFVEQAKEEEHARLAHNKKVEKDAKESADKEKEIAAKRIQEKGQEVTEEMKYQQRMLEVRQAANKKQKELLRDYESSLKEVRSLEAQQMVATDVFVNSKDKDKVAMAKEVYYGIEEELNLHKQRMIAIEEKYPVETQLLKEQAAKREFIRQSEEDLKESERRKAEIIAQNQQTKSNNQNYQKQWKEQADAYVALFDEAIKREEKNKADARNYELQGFLDLQNKKKQAEADMRSIEQRNHAEKLKEYEEMFAALDRTEKRRKAIYNATADLSKGAMHYADRVLSGQKPQTVNNLQKALQGLQEAQNKLNLSTSDGVKTFNALQNKINSVETALNKAKGSTDKFKEANDSLSGVVNKLKSSMMGLFGLQAITGYIKKVRDVRGEFEMQHKAMQVLIGDIDKANELWDKTIQLAVQSPFKVRDLVKYTKQLSAYRIETDLLFDKTKMLADISSGLGVDMNRLILAYGQVKAANYLRGTELRQFSEAGINVLQELATYFSDIEGHAVSVGEVFERVSKRMVSFRDVDAVLTKVTSEGGTFYQMQEQQAETLQGMVMNLHDSIDLMLNDIGKNNDGVLKGSITLLRELIENWREVGFFLAGTAIAFTPLIAATKAFGVASKKNGNEVIKMNAKIEAAVGKLTIKQIQSMTLAEAKVMGLTRSQFLLAKATMVAKGALIGLKTVLKSLIGFGIMAAVSAIIGLLVELARRMTQASREAKRLNKELTNIKNEGLHNLDKETKGFEDLVARLEMANEGTIERKKIIDQLNSRYGDYLDFVVRENTEISRLKGSYDDVIERMKAKYKLETYQKSIEAVEKTYSDGYQSAKDDFSEKMGWGVQSETDMYWVTPSKKEIEQIFSLFKQKLNTLELEAIDTNKEVKEVFKSVLNNYYDKEHMRTKFNAANLEIVELEVNRRKQELEIEKEINKQYEVALESRKAQNELEETRLNYKTKRDTIGKNVYDDFERQKKLDELAQQEKLDIIEIKLKYNLISDKEAEQQRNAIINWATKSTKAANEAITEAFNTEVEAADVIKQKMNAVGAEMNKMFKGNVDLLKRQLIPAADLAAKGWENVGEGVATVFSSQYEIKDKDGNMREIIVTPILPDGSVLSPEELDAYVNEKLQGTDILNADFKSIVIGVDVDQNSGEQLHLMQQEYYEFAEQLRNTVSEADLSKVLITQLSQTEKGWTEYLNGIKSSWETQKQIIEEEISKQSSFGYYDKARLENAEKMERLYRNVANILGLEIEHTERLTEETREFINDILPEKYQITLEDAYKGDVAVLEKLKKAQDDIIAKLTRINEKKAEGIPLSEDEVENAELYAQYLQQIAAARDKVDSTVKTPIKKERAEEVNAKLDDKYKLSAIDMTKDEVTLLQEANTAKENAIAYEEQLLAMKSKGIKVTKEELDAAKRAKEQTTLKWQLLGGQDKNGGKKGDLTEEQIRVIDNMNKKFRELNKTMSYSESVEGAFNAYKDAFENAFGKTKFLKGKNIKKMSPEDFTKEVLNFPDRNAVVEFLDDLADIVPNLEDKIRVELAKGKHVEEMDVEARVNLHTDIQEKVEDMFGNYEISMELKEMNIPEDIAERVFGVNPIKLPELKHSVIKEYINGVDIAAEKQKQLFDELNKEASAINWVKISEELGTEQAEALRKNLQEISQMEKDERMERLKTYSQYLVKEQHERIKLKMEEIRKISEIESMNEFDDKDKEVMKANIQRETNQNIEKSYWEDFEKSPMFVNLFDDMDKATKQSLTSMKSQLENMRQSMIAAGIPASELKDILEKINKVEEELEQRNPFSGLKSLGAVVLGTGGDSTISRKEFKKAKRDESTLLADSERLRNEEKEALKLVEAKKTELATAESLLDASEKGSDAYKSQEQQVIKIRGELSGLVSKHQDAVKNVEKNNKELDEAQQKTRKWKEQCENVANGFLNVKNAVNQIGGALGTALEQTGLMNEEDSAIFNSAMNVANDALSLGANLASGNIVGAIASGISLIGNLAATGDAVRQKAINAELEKAEAAKKTYDDLVDKYQDLQKAMERAYTIDQMNSNKDSMKDNLDAQSDSIDKQIAALEEANRQEAELKKPDQAAIDSRNQQIEELQKQQEELIKQEEEMNKAFVEKLGGTYDYAGVAEQFLDAWMNAFEETGDGLSGLDDSFDDFWKNILKKQVIYNGASKIMEKYINSINSALDDGLISDAEMSTMDSLEKETKENLDNFYKRMNEKYDLSTLSTDAELSGLQKGIQGITEDQADILSAYWNAVRFDVSVIRQKFEAYVDMQGGSGDNNPIATQLKTIASNTGSTVTKLAAIIKMLEDVTGTSGGTGLGIRTYLNS